MFQTPTGNLPWNSVIPLSYQKGLFDKPEYMKRLPTIHNDRLFEKPPTDNSNQTLVQLPSVSSKVRKSSFLLLQENEVVTMKFDIDMWVDEARSG